jgi:hypothetical protein
MSGFQADMIMRYEVEKKKKNQSGNTERRAEVLCSKGR